MKGLPGVVCKVCQGVELVRDPSARLENGQMSFYC